MLGQTCQEDGVVHSIKCCGLALELETADMSTTSPPLSSFSTDELIKKITEAGIQINEEEARKFRGK